MANNVSLNQDSGLVASAKFANFFYTHNDRSNMNTKGMFFMIGPVVAGQTLTTRTYMLPSAVTSTVVDTEEIQVGPGPKVNTSFLYFGDIGDNDHTRANIQIFRTEEPAQFTIDSTHRSQTLSSSAVETLLLRYPDDFYNSWNHGTGQLKLNSEAFFIDPVTGTLYIIEKPCGGWGLTGSSVIFSMPAPLPFDGAVHTLDAIFAGSIDTTGFSGTEHNETNCADQTAATGGHRVTGAAINRTGTAVMVTGYGTTKFWWLGPYRGLGSSAWGEPGALMSINAPTPYGWECDLNATAPGAMQDVDAPPGFLNMREAITFTRDTLNSGVHFLTTGEGANGHPIWRY